MNAIEFYNYTRKVYNDLAEQYGVNGEEYLSMTDFNENWIYKANYNLSYDTEEDKLKFIFAQMAYHAQNGGLVRNIIKFDQKTDIINELFYGFDVNLFLENYKGKDPEEIADIFYEHGLTWDRTKKKTDKSSLVAKYCECVMNCAKYIKEKGSKEAILDDFKQHEDKTKPQTLIKYLKNDIFKKQYGVALVCDFLKEFDEHFSYLCKPDVHVTDTINMLKDTRYESKDSDKYKVIFEFIKLVNEINEGLEDDKKITGYQLDRMIYIICSQNFFMDGIAGYKKAYLSQII